MPALRARSVALTGYLERLLEAIGVELADPRDPAARGAQLSLRFATPEAILSGLAARGVIADIRAPDIIRLAPIPLYTTYDEVWRAAVDPRPADRYRAAGLAEARPEARQDELAVAGDRRFLVLAREVEDEVVEAVADVRRDLLDVLVGVVRDEPAPVGDVLDALRQPLHLARILDAHLLLAGQRQRGPDLGVLHRPGAVGVEADLHLDHPVDAWRVAVRP